METTTIEVVMTLVEIIVETNHLVAVTIDVVAVVGEVIMAVVVVVVVVVVVTIMVVTDRLRETTTKTTGTIIQAETQWLNNNSNNRLHQRYHSQQHLRLGTLTMKTGMNKPFMGHKFYFFFMDFGLKNNLIRFSFWLRYSSIFTHSLVQLLYIKTSKSSSYYYLFYF